jgi:hypothetical protein
MSEPAYVDELQRLAEQIGNPDVDLEISMIASRHGKSESAVTADLKHVRPSGAALLQNAHDFIARFCALPSEHALVAVTLWAALTHMVKHFHTSPRLAALSPEPASGKTRLLEVLAILVANSMFSLAASPAAIFRTLADRFVTLLFDEVDATFSRKGKDDNNEDLRALLNAGYKLGASIPRCVGPRHDIVEFPVYCPVALAGLGDLPDTIMSRSVIIRMRRRAPDEHIEPFRSRQHEPEGHALRDHLADWAEEVGPAAGEAWPKLPPGIEDRPAEVWEPLIAVADAAGGAWPARARAACVELVKVAADRRASLGVRLLADLRTIFIHNEAMHTADIIERLVAGDGLEADAPWGDLRGKPITVRALASMLKPYGIHSLKVWADGRALQGYRREHLHDAWVRYLSPLPGNPEGAEGPHSERATDLPDLPYIPETRTPESAPDEVDL